jgi:hypothetical protein
VGLPPRPGELSLLLAFKISRYYLIMAQMCAVDVNLAAASKIKILVCPRQTYPEGLDETRYVQRFFVAHRCFNHRL